MVTPQAAPNARRRPTHHADVDNFIAFVRMLLKQRIEPPCLRRNSPAFLKREELGRLLK
jgi:hypothetical protein